MKIKSNLEFNTAISASHVAKSATDKVVIGGAAPARIVIPAGATLQLSDNEWKAFEHAAAPLIASGSLTLIEAPALSEAEVEARDAAELVKAKAVIDAAETKIKAKFKSKPKKDEEG